MKKLILIFMGLIFFMVSIQAQSIRQHGVYKIFPKNVSVWADSIGHIADSLYTDSTSEKGNETYPYAYVKSTTAADTLYGAIFETTKGNIQISVYTRFLDGAGTANALIEFGVERGQGYPDYTGWEWYEIETFSADGTAKFNLANTTANPWASYEHFRRYRIRITETGAQQNRYVLWIIEQKAN